MNQETSFGPKKLSCEQKIAKKSPTSAKKTNFSQNILKVENLRPAVRFLGTQAQL
jgi:hypothetical protein